MAMLALAVFSCVALASATVGLARETTTSPGSRVDTLVIIQNNGITVGESARLPRGVIVFFYVKNLTKTVKNFKFLGKETKPIRPGDQRTLRVVLNRRGVFPYLSTLNPARRFRGLFLVY